MCYLGQELVYEDASETLERLLGIETNAKQIERVCHHYGEVLEKQKQNEIAAGGSAPKITDGKKYYAMMDGSMILTREEGWKEIKLARIFSAEQKVSVSKDRNFIGEYLLVAAKLAAKGDAFNNSLLNSYGPAKYTARIAPRSSLQTVIMSG